MLSISLGARWWRFTRKLQHLQKSCQEVYDMGRMASYRKAWILRQFSTHSSLSRAIKTRMKQEIFQLD
eukprot:6760328-Ditylum_brightwellii.AAC.1